MKDYDKFVALIRLRDLLYFGVRPTLRQCGFPVEVIQELGKEGLIQSGDKKCGEDLDRYVIEEILPAGHTFIARQHVLRDRREMFRPVMQPTWPNTHNLLLVGFLALALPPLFAGCSLKRVAVNKVGNALADSGSSFASDDDPELVKAALPFSLKLMEGLLAENPNHKGLLLASASGFSQFAFAFVQQDADELEDSDFAAAEKLRARARRLYVRARNYGLRGLELAHPGFEKNLRANPKGTLQAARTRDVPLLYWTAAAWAASISLSKDDPDMLADLPFPEALMDRALALDESFADGAIHSFLIAYEMSRPNASTNAEANSRRHFERAMQLNHGLQAGPLVALAEAVSVQKQDLKEFESLLHRALAINPETEPEFRLANLVMQRRAKWLLSRTDQLFLQTSPAQPNP